MKSASKQRCRRSLAGELESKQENWRKNLSSKTVAAHVKSAHKQDSISGTVRE